MRKTAEILAFGDELVHGARINTNSAWLSQQLLDLGIEPAYHTLVGDDVHRSAAAIAIAVDRVDVVVCTGGLGPTADDVTRDALAAYLNVPLEEDAKQLQRIEELFRSRGRSMPARNRVQARAPVGCRFLANPHGTAPGLFALIHGNRPIVALPGVPAEMREMWPEVLRELRTLAMSNGAHVSRTLKCFGVGESHLEEMIATYTARDRNPSVGITVHEATISLRIVAHAEEQSVANRLADETAVSLRTVLGDLVFGQDQDELEDVVLRQLLDRGQTLAVLEIGTPGILTHWLQRGELASRVLLGGWMFPTWFAAGRIWPEIGASVAEGENIGQVADIVRNCAGADIGLVLSCQLDQQQARIGIATAESIREHADNLAGHPDVRFPRAAKAALNLLRF